MKNQFQLSNKNEEIYFNNEDSYNKIDLNDVIIDINAVKLVSKQLADKYCLIPIAMKKDMLYIVVDNIIDKQILEYIKFTSKKKIIPLIAEKDQIIAAISIYYEYGEEENILQELRNENEQYESLQKEKNQNNEENPTIKFTNLIINQAISKNASDIHIEPFEEVVVVRYRIDGVLQEIIRIPQEVYSSICIRLKLISKMDIAEKRIPQDGKFQKNLNDKKYDFRVSTMPTLYGEKIVIRILYKSEHIISLEELGFNKSNNKNINKIIGNEHGIVLVTGPTGSGKSTTLYALLNEIDRREKNIVTIEDPVEYNLFGINQINVNNKAGLTFAKGLRSILRQDPDVIMLGEIRDEETAQIAVRAAITGHLVFSTMHTNDAPSSILRLIDMGVPSYLVSDALIAVIAQRLVKRICPYCKSEYFIKEEEQKNLKFANIEKLYTGSGCIRCNNLGYKGRTVIYEIMYLDEKHRKIIESNGGVNELREYSLGKDMISIRDCCKELVINGITTYEEMLRVTL